MNSYVTVAAGIGCLFGANELGKSAQSESMTALRKGSTPGALSAHSGKVLGAGTLTAVGSALVVSGVFKLLTSE